MTDEDIDAIRKATDYCQPLGDDKFCKQIEEKLGRKIGLKKPGRPKKIIDQI